MLEIVSVTRGEKLLGDYRRRKKQIIKIVLKDKRKQMGILSSAARQIIWKSMGERKRVLNKLDEQFVLVG